MTRRHETLPFDTIRLEGTLFVPDLLEKIVRGEHTSQRESDYHIPKGLKLHDEYGRAFQIATAQWKGFAPTLERADIDALVTTRNFVQELLQDTLGYALEKDKIITISDRHYHLPFLACGSVPIFVAPGNLTLDDVSTLFTVEGSGSRKRSVFRLAQEFLNASTACTWAMVTNGRRIRLLRDSLTLTRPCFLEFDLETILAGNRYPDFAALWRTLHASRAGTPDKRGASSVWEQWRTEGQSQGTRVRDGLRYGVTKALVALGNGFLSHPANTALHARLNDGHLSADCYFQELLRLVYRCLFIFTLEERKDEQTNIPLLHAPDIRAEAQTARSIYADGYSLKRLRNRVLRSTGRDRYDDLWQGLIIVFRALYRGEPRLALPALGGLFSPEQCPDLDASSLPNHALLETIACLRWAHIDGNLVPVDYRNMGPEELGSVYESLLELVPAIDLPARTFGFIGITEEGDASGHARKTTGSYYTPDSLVQELIKSALDPVIQSRLAARPDNPTEALLAITVIDPACGSGHFLLAAARRLAEHLAELRAVDGAVRPEDYRHALREVIAHCIFGVDKNPMALELARTALWLEGFEPGRPLSFLDHHLICGDALLGLINLKQMENGIPDAAFKPLSGDDKVICKELGKINRAGRKTLVLRHKGQRSLFAPITQESAWSRLAAIDSLSDTTLGEVEAKGNAYAAFLRDASDSPVTRAADCFISAFLTPKGKEVSLADVPISGTLLVELFGDAATHSHPACLQTAKDLCIVNRTLHWPLSFPQIFSKGGFDCVLANPPWERIKIQEEEFFATRHPEIAKARNKAERGQYITLLKEGMLAKHLHPEILHVDRDCEDEKRLYSEFIYIRRTAEAASIFAHLKAEEGGRYPFTGVGDINTYALFSEVISQIISPQGRAGFIVPSGLATDNTTKDFFGSLITNQTLESFFEFENEGFFPGAGQGHMLRFALCTIVGTATKACKTRFLFQGKHLEELTNKDRAFSLSPSDIFLVNPNTRTCPIFQSRRDAEITNAIYSRVPVLIKEGAEKGLAFNPWGIQFMRMFDMANDSHLFKTRADMEAAGFALKGNCFVRENERYVPLYEAKMIHQYNHRHGDFADSPDGQRVHVLPTIPLERLRNTSYLTLPFYWVLEKEVDQLLRDKGWTAKWLIGWRDVTDARASARTLNATVIPIAAANDGFLLLLPTVETKKAAALLGNMSALVCDYVTRQKVGGLHLKYFTLKQIPILAPKDYSKVDLDFLVPRVLELTYTSDDLQGWAEDLGYSGPPFPFDPERRANLRAELDAYYARLYGLTRDELRYILDPADIMGEDYPSETFRVLKNNEIRNFGEYRTQQLVLEAWDKLATTTYSVDNQSTYHEDPQIFPWPGRERFIYNLIPDLVHAKVGMQFEYYRDAALLASRPEYLRQLLSSKNIALFDALPQDIKNACTFPTEHHVRPRQLRKRLTANGQIDIDAANGSTQLGAAVDVPQTLPGMDHLIPFILEAADNLRQHQERTIEVLDSKERETVIQVVQFLQTAVGWE